MLTLPTAKAGGVSTDADIAFLIAMAQDEKETTRADLMKRLGKPSSHISTYKKGFLMED